MREVYFGDFREYVTRYYREIAGRDPDFQSTEWFLLRYLRRIDKATNPPVVRGQVENSMRGFVRFYVDMIDEKSELGEICVRIYEEYRRTLRCYQEE